MYYQYPLYDNKPQYVPIVVKNKDFLLGFLKSKDILQNIVETIGDIFEIDGIVEPNVFDEYLDSSRFNDVMEDGSRESEYTTEELVKYYTDKFVNRFEKDRSRKQDDLKIFEGDLLTIECICGLGIYSFKSEKQIPDENFICNICGRTIIHYTNHNDNVYDYEGA